MVWNRQQTHRGRWVIQGENKKRENIQEAQLNEWHSKRGRDKGVLRRERCGEKAKEGNARKLRSQKFP